MVKRGGQTRRFAVPVLDVEISPAQLIGGGQQPVMVEQGTGRVLDDSEVRAIAGAAPLTPVPESVPERPVASVAEQAAAVPRRRRSSQQPIPETGLMPRTVEQAERGEDAVTKPQLQKLSILRQKAGYPDTDEGRVDWFAWVAQQISREVGSNKELTRAEASVLIDVLEGETAASADGEAADGGA